MIKRALLYTALGACLVLSACASLRIPKEVRDAQKCMKCGYRP